jgi:two-component system, cell cycle response regulator DivK
MGNRQSTILVVDDNSTNLKLVTDVLGFEDHRIVAAMNAKQAQTVVHQAPPDLLLMEINLPDMDGLALTQILKNDEKTRHIVIVALKPLAMKGDHAKAVASWLRWLYH